MEYPFLAHSWIVLSDQIAVKKMDKSSFLHHGTGIPKEICEFFELPAEGLSSPRSILLELDNTIYDAHIEMDVLHKRFRMFWKSNLSQHIKNLFPDAYRAFESGREDVPVPDMRFERSSDSAYTVTFSSEPTLVAPALRRESRNREYTLYEPSQRGKVVLSYLTEGLSHREIDEKVLGLDKEYSRGYQAMGILHYLGLDNAYKGFLKGRTLQQVIQFCQNCSTPDLTHLLPDLSAIGGATPEAFESMSERFERQVESSQKDASEKRKQRLAVASAKPQKTQVIATAYKRNPDVVADVLARANGICELCKQPAPFVRKKNGEPYLEVHHTIQLADGGEDTVENAVAACPNCHRREHFGV